MTDIEQIDLSGIPDAEVKPPMVKISPLMPDEFAPPEIDFYEITPTTKPITPENQQQTLGDVIASICRRK